MSPVDGLVELFQLLNRSPSDELNISVVVQLLDRAHRVHMINKELNYGVIVEVYIYVLHILYL